MDSIDAEIRGLQQVRGGGLIDIFNVEPFEGTVLFERLAREGRLEGGPLLWHFWPEDAAARRFSEYLHLVKRELFGFTHLTAFAYETLGAWSVARRLGLFGARTGRHDKVARQLIARHNDLWIHLLEKLAAFSRDEPSTLEMNAFLRGIQVDSANLILAFREFRGEGESLSGRSLRSETFYGPTAAAVAVALSILATACSHVGDPVDEEDTSTWVDTTVQGETDSVPSLDPVDSAADTEGDTGGGTDTRPLIWDTDGTCINHSVLSDEVSTLEETALGAGCLDLYTICYGEDDFRYAFVLDEEGYAVDMVKDSGTPLSPEIVDCYLDAVAGQQFPCLANWKYGRVWRCDYILLE
jgi:hypothetical protein